TQDALYTISSDGAVFRLGSDLKDWEVVGNEEQLPLPPWSGSRLAPNLRPSLFAGEETLRTWSILGLPLRGSTGTEIRALITFGPAQRPRDLFAAKYGVVYTSRDGGASWTTLSKLPDSAGPLRQLVILPGNPDRLVVLTQHAGLWALQL